MLRLTSRTAFRKIGAKGNFVFALGHSAILYIEKFLHKDYDIFKTEDRRGAIRYLYIFSHSQEDTEKLYRLKEYLDQNNVSEDEYIIASAHEKTML